MSERCWDGVGEVCRVVEEVFGGCVGGGWGGCGGGVSGCGGGVGGVCRGGVGEVLGMCVGGVGEVCLGVSGRCVRGCRGGDGEVCWGWDDVEKCEDGSRPATRSALLSGYLGKSGHLPR